MQAVNADLRRTEHLQLIVALIMKQYQSALLPRLGLRRVAEVEQARHPVHHYRHPRPHRRERFLLPLRFGKLPEDAPPRLASARALGAVLQDRRLMG